MASGSSPMNKIDMAHQMYREGKYAEALQSYTEAFSMARTNPQKIALHSNRAACYLRLHDFNKAAEECAAVLELDRKHTGALMLRAQTLVTLKEYNSALFDVNQLIELNPTSEVYQNLQSRLRTQLSLATIPEEEEMSEEEDHDAQNDNKEDEEETQVTASQDLTPQEPSSSSFRTITKPKAHCNLDYSRWENVKDDSSEENEDFDDDDEDDCQPQFKFRVKSVGVRAIK